MNDYADPMPGSRVDPNPYSPFATADTDLRHLIPVPLFFPAPVPGRLALTGCGRMAVVPPKVGRIREELRLVPGGCAPCFDTMAALAAGAGAGMFAPGLPPAICGTCRSPSSQGAMCAICRAEAHAAWTGQRTARGDNMAWTKDPVFAGWQWHEDVYDGAVPPIGIWTGGYTLALPENPTDPIPEGFSLIGLAYGVDVVVDETEIRSGSGTRRRLRNTRASIQWGGLAPFGLTHAQTLVVRMINQCGHRAEPIPDLVAVGEVHRSMFPRVVHIDSHGLWQSEHEIQFDDHAGYTVKHHLRVD